MQAESFKSFQLGSSQVPCLSCTKSADEPGFIRLMATPDDVTGPVNLGNPHEIPVRELAERVIRLTGSRSTIVYRPLSQDDPTQRCPDITLARKLLDWEPTVALDDGLQRTIAYFASLLAHGVEGASHVEAVA